MAEAIPDWKVVICNLFEFRWTWLVAKKKTNCLGAVYRIVSIQTVDSCAICKSFGFNKLINLFGRCSTNWAHSLKWKANLRNNISDFVHRVFQKFVAYKGDSRKQPMYVYMFVYLSSMNIQCCNFAGIATKIKNLPQTALKYFEKLRLWISQLSTFAFTSCSGPECSSPRLDDTHFFFINSTILVVFSETTA